MALTKPMFYVIALGFAIMVFSGLLLVGNDLNNNTGINLDQDSKDYISSYSGYLENANVSSYDVEDKTYQTQSITQDDEGTGDAVITDVFATLNFWRNAVSKIENFFKLAYNIPTLFINLLGLPTGGFNHYLNVLGIMLFIGLTIMIIRLVRGS